MWRMQLIKIWSACGQREVWHVAEWTMNMYHCKTWSRYRPGVTQRVGRGIALLFHDRGTRREWVVSSTLRPHFTPGKDPVPILQEAGWARGPVWRGGKSRPHRDSIPDPPARNSVAIPTELHDPHVSLYLSIIPYIMHNKTCTTNNKKEIIKNAIQKVRLVCRYFFLLHFFL